MHRQVQRMSSPACGYRAAEGEGITRLPGNLVATAISVRGARRQAQDLRPTCRRWIPRGPTTHDHPSKSGKIGAILSQWTLDVALVSLLDSARGAGGVMLHVNGRVSAMPMRHLAPRTATLRQLNLLRATAAAREHGQMGQQEITPAGAGDVAMLK